MATKPSTGSSFSCNGTYFALLSIDNRLRIWDVTSGKLLREFSSASHVESTCTCLCWTRGNETPNVGNVKDGKRKKKKTQTEPDQLSNILIGYSNGQILLYNPTADVQDGVYSDGHFGKVNCISFDPSNEKFYSCSDDKCIAEWSTDGKEILSKWKADKTSVQMIALGPSGKSLLSAGMSIKLWDLETKKEMMRFDGHASPVSLLQFSGFRTPGKNTDDDDGCYFLSGSREDRLISAWHINLLKPERSTIATFMTTDVPVFMKSSVSQQDNRPVKLAVGCESGKVHFFVCSMNGKVSRPIEDFKILSVSKREGEKSNLTPATLLSAVMDNSDGAVVLKLASGSSLKPDFHDYNFSLARRHGKIIKDVIKNMFLKDQTNEKNSPVELAEIRGKQHVIGNTYNVPKALDINDNVKDRQKTEDLSMDERLKNTSPANLHPQIQSSNAAPNAASFSVLLIQGLHTNDVKLIHEILSKKVSHKIIRNTVQRMPPGVIVEFLNLIVDKIQYNPLPSISNNMSVWIRSIMTVHLSSLVTKPDVAATLGKLFTLLKAQQEIYPSLFSLQGKIDLLISQVTKDSIDKDEKVKEKEEEEMMNPSLVFHDDSEDEDELLARIRNESEGEATNEDDEEEDDDDDDNGDDDSDADEAESSDEEMEEKGQAVDGSDDSGTY